MVAPWRADFKRNDQRIMRYFFTFAKENLGWAGLGPMNTAEGKSNLSRSRVEAFALGQGCFIHWPLTPRTPIADVELWTGGGRSMVSDQPPAQVGRASYYSALQREFPAVFMQNGLTAAAYHAAHNLRAGGNLSAAPAVPAAPVLPINSTPDFNAPVSAPAPAPLPAVAADISAPADPVVANQDDLPAALPELEIREQQQQQQQAAALPAVDPAAIEWSQVDWASMSPEDFAFWVSIFDQHVAAAPAVPAEPEAPQMPALSGPEDMAPADLPLLEELQEGLQPVAAFEGNGFNFGEPELAADAAQSDFNPGDWFNYPADTPMADMPADTSSGGVTEPQPLELPSSAAGPGYLDQAEQLPSFGLPDLTLPDLDLSLGAETEELLDWTMEDFNPVLF